MEATLVAMVESDFVTAEKSDFESPIEATESDDGEVDLETIRVVVRMSKKPNTPAVATERIGFARAYSFQSTSRLASTCNSTTCRFAEDRITRIRSVICSESMTGGSMDGFMKCAFVLASRVYAIRISIDCSVLSCLPALLRVGGTSEWMICCFHALHASVKQLGYR